MSTPAPTPTPTPTTVHDQPALEPVALGALELRNRLAVAPMTRVSARSDGTPTARMAQYYESFARGGFGLVLTEGIHTDHRYSQGYLNQPGLVTDEHVAGWQRITDAVHAAGAPVVAQLMHAGALSQGNAHSDVTAGPSAVPPVGTKMPEYGGSGAWPTPREMTRSDIDDAVAGFVDAARHARAAGFDGVEIHAANGYLLDQFLTDYTNRRSDEYGGSVRQRVRLTADVTAAIRAALPAPFVVGVRLSQTKVNDFTYRWPGGARDADVIFAALASAGADYLHVASEGRDWIDTARLDNGETITAIARKTGGVPVIANGGMHDPGQGASVLRDGHADLLSIGRGALANPDLPNRWAAGHAIERFDHGMLDPMATLENADEWRRRIGDEETQ